MAPPQAKATRRAAQKRGRKQRDDDDEVEDLDLHVPVSADGDEEDDSAIVANRRHRRVGSMLDVAPSDAHKQEGRDVDDGVGFSDVQEGELAVATMRHVKRHLAEDDFMPIPASAAGKAAAPKRSAAATPAAPTTSSTAQLNTAIEKVERDFAALTDDERLEVLKRESPEVLRLMTEFRQNVEEVRTLAATLKKTPVRRVASGGTANARLVGFLQTKLQLLLAYCVHVAFFLLLKAEGRKVAGHPVLDRLVELRVYLDKLHPVEQKLQHSLNKLLTTTPTSSAGATIGPLRPVAADGDDGEGGVYRPSKTVLVDQQAKARRAAEQAAREAEALEREELNNFMRVHKKKPAAVDPNAALDGAANAGGEAEDRFFSKLARQGDSDDDDDAAARPSAKKRSLREVLADRMKALQQHSAESAVVKDRRAAAKALQREEDEADEGADGDMIDAMEGDEDAAYEALVAEQRARDELAAEEEERLGEQAEEDGDAAAPRGVGRRLISKNIESHRGLTKARPKDKKNPRVAQRLKFAAGERKAKAAAKPVKLPERGDFVGVSQAIKPHLVHSKRFD